MVETAVSHVTQHNINLINKTLFILYWTTVAWQYVMYKTNNRRDL